MRLAINAQHFSRITCPQIVAPLLSMVNVENDTPAALCNVVLLNTAGQEVAKHME